MVGLHLLPADYANNNSFDDGYSSGYSCSTRSYGDSVLSPDVSDLESAGLVSWDCATRWQSIDSDWPYDETLSCSVDNDHKGERLRRAKKRPSSLTKWLSLRQKYARVNAKIVKYLDERSARRAAAETGGGVALTAQNWLFFSPIGSCLSPLVVARRSPTASPAASTSVQQADSQSLTAAYYDELNGNVLMDSDNVNVTHSIVTDVVSATLPIGDTLSCDENSADSIGLPPEMQCVSERCVQSDSALASASSDSLSAEAASGELGVEPSAVDSGDSEPREKDDVEDALERLGWRRYFDAQGAYYWHVSTGNIQRQRPHLSQHSSVPASPSATPVSPMLPLTGSCSSMATPPSADADSSTPYSFSDGAADADTDADADAEGDQLAQSMLTTEADPLKEFENLALRIVSGHMSEAVKKRLDTDADGGSDALDGDGHSLRRFAVQSVGWMPIDADQLTPERSSRAVNDCIVALASGRTRDFNEGVGRWGHGKELLLELHLDVLKLLDPVTLVTLNRQPIQSIRVWGVGRDCGRDFAYVARDRVTRQYMCHVFRCEERARQVATALHDICQQVLEKRRLATAAQPERAAPQPPPDLPLAAHLPLVAQPALVHLPFPVAADEPKKVIKCGFGGAYLVEASRGMEVLNKAIELALNNASPLTWPRVSVSVAPSTVIVTSIEGSETKLAECRVRFLSFLGIYSSGMQLCAFIMHTARNEFLAHVFHCEPTAGPLCKAIEAACKLRYQKCLDAYPSPPSQQTASSEFDSPNSVSKSASFSFSLKQGLSNMFGYWKKGSPNGRPPV